MALNGISNGSSPTLEWKVGLCKKDSGKVVYLTAEKVQNMINASATAMKAKQLWTIEHDDTDADVVYIRSPMGCYLSGDRHGKLTSCTDEKGSETKFILEYDGTGRWAFKNHSHGLYFGGEGEYLHCNGKAAGEGEWWTVRLAVHPQVNLKSINRKRYAHLHEEENKIHVDEIIPWGQDALLTIDFMDGKYAVKTCNNKYLHRNGDLVDETSRDTLFTLQLKSGQNSGMALKDLHGKFLTAVGKTGAMQSKASAISKDEIFRLEDSHPQVYLTAHNGKKVSIKQGVDISANQSEVSDSEIFQLEYVSGTHWRLRTSEDKCWFLADANGIQRGGSSRDAKTLFDLEYLEDGSIAMKASNGQYVNAAQNGSLYATSKAIESKERFQLTIINRPLLVLRCEHGFVGLTSTTNNKLQCNRATHDVFTMEASGDSNQKGEYFIKGSNGLYWCIGGDRSVQACSSQPKPFRLILKGQSKFAIRADSGQYIKGEQNGLMEAKVDIDKATLWEF